MENNSYFFKLVWLAIHPSHMWMSVGILQLIKALIISMDIEVKE